MSEQILKQNTKTTDSKAEFILTKANCKLNSPYLFDDKIQLAKDKSRKKSQKCYTSSNAIILNRSL